MLNPVLAELEQQFRKSWRMDITRDFQLYLNQVPQEDRVELLAMLLSAELELAYQPEVLKCDAPTIAEEDETTKPRIRLLLARFPELKQRDDLVLQLVMLEVALRVRFDSTAVNCDSYIDLCPKGKDRIESLLQIMRSTWTRNQTEPTPVFLAGVSDTTVTEALAPSSISLNQLPCSLGYFLVTDVIGKGGMGYVYSGIDLRSAAHVAIKVMRRLDLWSIYRFNEEFSWLSRLSHPNIVKLYDAFSDADLRYFSMQLVEGTSIRAWFERIAQQDDARARLIAVLSQAASAIQFLHDNGVVHRDIKSSNVMINRQECAMVLDMGLAFRVSQAQQSLRSIDGFKVVGTLQYLPPETLNGQPPSVEGDWYSFGVMMFETLTGDYPPIHIDVKVAEQLPKQFVVDEPAMRRLLAHCPTELADLCSGLLSIDPSSRPRGREVLLRLGLGPPSSVFEPSTKDCYWRKDSWKFLDDAYELLTRGEGVVRFVRGDSGLGKSTLLAHWLEQRSAGQSDWLVLNVRCHRQDHSPLRALNLLVQELVTQLANEPTDFWRDLLVEGGSELAHAFPQIERLTSIQWPSIDSPASPVESAARRAAGLHALLGWLIGLSQKRQLIIAIDDAHWADVDSGRILAQLFQVNSRFRGMLIVIDQDTSVTSPLVDALIAGANYREPNFAQHKFPPLESSTCHELVRKWFEGSAVRYRESIANELVNRAQGNLFLLRELFRTYLDSAARNDAQSDSWLEGDEPDVGGILKRRFSMLPNRAEQILQFLAVSDEPLGFHQLQIATRIMPDHLLADLSLLSSQGWLRLYGATLDSEIEISHDRFREAILQAIPDERLHRRHCRIARTLSSEAPPPWRRIAYHYDKACRFREAAACYLEGARAAARVAAYAEALWMLERAIRPEADRSREESYEVERLRADCLAGNGSSIAAAELYDSLQSTSVDPSERLLLECLAGEQWLRGGRLRVGLARLRNALESVNANLDRRPLRSRLRVLVTALRLSFLRPSMSVFRAGGHAFSLVEQCLCRVSGPLSFLDHLLGAALVTELVSLSLTKGTNYDRALMVMRWSVVLSFAYPASQLRAIKWLRVARALSRKVNDPNCQAMRYLAAFLRHSLLGHFRKALVYQQRAQQLSQSDGTLDHWEAGFLRWIELKHRWHLGELATLCESTHAFRADAVERCDEMATYWTHINGSHLADLIEGDSLQAQRSISVAQQVVAEAPFQTPQVFLWIAQVRQLLYDDQPEAARDKLLQMWPQVKKTRMTNVHSYAWVIYELRICCDIACIVNSVGKRDTLLRDARTYVRRLLRFGEPVFRTHGQGFQIVIDSLVGKTISDQAWERVEKALLKADLHLFFIALRWYRGTQSQGDAGSRMRRWAIEQLRRQGCAEPHRLMNLILPLKRQRGVSTDETL